MCLLLVLLLPGQLTLAFGSTWTQAEEVNLRLGVAVERQLAGGETHAYRVSVSAGQFVRLVVVQKGIDVALRLYAPDGRKLSEVDNVGREETIFAVADSAGELRVEVVSGVKETPAGVYEIRLDALREASDKDRAAVAAEGLLEEANRLRDQRTAESRQQAILKYEEALLQWRAAGEKRGEALTLEGLGVTYSSIGQLAKAVGCYEQAVLLWHDLGLQLSEAATLTNMGTAHWRAGETKKALESHGRALPLARAAGDPQIEGLVLSNTGAVYWSLGQPLEALKFFGQALPSFQRLGNQRLQAVTLNNIASAYQQLGDLQSASDALTQALALRRAMGDRQGEAAPLNNLGLLYMRLGDLPRALESYNRALEIRRAAGERQWEATVLQGLSVVYLHLGEKERAVESAGQALTIARELGDRRLEAYILVVLGNIHQLSGDAKSALDSFEQSLALRRAAGDRWGEAYTLTNIGESHLRLGEQAKALEHFRQALSLSRDMGDRLGEATTLYASARAFSQAGDEGTALTQIESALAIIESTRARVRGQDLRSTFLASVQDYYAFSVEQLMRMHRASPSVGHDAEALQASERGRARGLLELLSEARVDIREGVDAALLERGRVLQQQLNFKAEALARLQSAKHTEEQEAAAKKELAALLDEFREVEAQIREKSPRYAALTQPQPLSAKEIMRLLDDDTLLLEYALGEERSYLWAVTPTSVKSFELPKRAEVEASARRLYEALTARSKVVRFEKEGERLRRVAKADADFREAAAELSRLILGPLGGELGKKRLVIVNDGALQYVPFGALPLPAVSTLRGGSFKAAPAGGYRPLIVEHEVVSLPSASALGVMRRESAGRRRGDKTVMVLADPVFTEGDPRVRRSLTESGLRAEGTSEAAHETRAASGELERALRDMGGLTFSRLRYTRQEAEGILALTPPGEGRKSLDFEASRETATGADIGRYRIVHFATHGILNSTHPELSGLVLSLVDRQGQRRDGFLRAFEIYNLHLGADLVVLSACRTALGTEIRGEGLAGLTRGFMYAGAPRLVASLWGVEDESTAMLMKRFYREMLVSGKRPAAALRAAQLGMWKSRGLPPYYWAGFVLQGEWR
jgi:tetratricopeptide (TPR) repeat protein